MEDAYSSLIRPERLKTEKVILSLLAFTIFYQQIFVINIGASLKIYELIAFCLLLFFLVRTKKVCYGKISFVFFLFFIVVPTLSYISYLFNPEKLLYYQRYPEAFDLLRANIYLVPTILLVYYYFNWATINYVIGSDYAYENKNRIIRIFIYSASIVCLYNILTIISVSFMGGSDLIPEFLDFRNTSYEECKRVGGFSAEPGTYVVLQTWVVYYLFFYSKRLKLKWLFVLRTINLFCLLFTLSSLLLPALLIFLVVLLKRLKMKYRLLFIAVLGGIIIKGVEFIKSNELDEIVRYVIVEKVGNYVSAPTDTLDSGSFRSFTSRVGLEIFKDYPIIGCGGGTSCFFMWKYEHKMGIMKWGEELKMTNYPQNGFSKVLAELGIVGFSLLMIGLFSALYKFWVHRKESDFCRVSLYGAIFTLISYMSVYPETSLFLWFNIALGLNDVYHIENKRNILEPDGRVY